MLAPPQQTTTPNPALVAWLQERVRLVTAEADTQKLQTDQWRQRAQSAESQIASLQTDVERLTARLRFYENANTPPSQRRIPKPRNKTTTTPKKRGAPVGHRGNTYTPPPPDKETQLHADACPDCQAPTNAPVDSSTRTITDILPPAGLSVTRFVAAIYQCDSCGNTFTARDPNLPTEGQWGINMLVLMTMLKYHVRGPLRRVADFMAHNEGIPISPKGVMDALNRVAKSCQRAYGDIAQRVRDAPWVHVDETTIKVNGTKWWIWKFRTPDDHVLTLIRPSRKRTVVTEVFGDKPPPLVVDGAGMYKHAKQLQRCWSHLLREADDAKDAGDKAVQLADALHALFGRLKEALARPMTTDERVAQKAAFESELAALVVSYDGEPSVKRVLTYVKGGMGAWFTCVLFPGMAPTNNAAEQALREDVVVRKLIGSFRSETGAECYQYLASMLVTWRLQALDPFEQLEALLRRDLCGT